MEKVVIGNYPALFAGLIGKGGEGKVYAIEGRSDKVVKIYNEALRATREEKVRAMVAARLTAETDLVAYPDEVVTDHHGNFLGFAMPFVSGYLPLHELYTPKSRQRRFANADYRFIVHAARNVARAVGKVHQTGCVIGDLNHSGVLVASNGTVALIDADSFQFNLQGKIYPCVVGVPDFTPPELHKTNLAAVQRTVEHDHFGLAVAIFQLLFMGRHPYAGRHLGPDVSLGEAIAQNRFAYTRSRHASTLASPPPGALSLDAFPDAISSAFEKAFGVNPDARPSAIEWISALGNLENTLIRCIRVNTHFYPKHCAGCVWCKLAEGSSFDMFPGLISVTPAAPPDERSTEEAIREVLSLRLPTLADWLPAAPVLSGASKRLRKARTSRWGCLVFALLFVAPVLLIVSTTFDKHNLISCFLVLLCVLLVYQIYSMSKTIEPGPFQVEFDSADKGVQGELNAFVRRNSMNEIVKMLGNINGIIERYKNHDEVLRVEINKFYFCREERQLNAHLKRCRINEANIPGIGTARMASLAQMGILTAADIDAANIQRVPGFGSYLASDLLAWRRLQESNFKYDPTPNVQDAVDENELRQKFAEEKENLAAAIRYSLRHIKKFTSNLDTLRAAAKNDATLMNAIKLRAEAERDLRELGLLVPPSKVVLLAIES